MKPRSLAMKKYRATHPEYVKGINKRKRERRLQRKIKVFNYYSGGLMSCQCCGVKEVDFLTIDHIGGGGCNHRKEIKKGCGVDFYKWLIDNNLPEGYQVLCFNCNCAIRFTKICPHKVKKNRG